MSLRAAGFAFVTALTIGLPTVYGAAVSRQQADSFSRKVARISAQGDTPARPTGTARRTEITESELNSWFVYRAGPSLPTGLTDPRITLVGDRKVTGTAVVDLDAVARSRSTGGTFDIWNLVGGRVPVTVGGVVSTQNGRARFDLQQAEISGVPIPRRVVQELVDYYSRTPDHPSGVRLDEEFELPSGIQRVDISPGVVVVVQ